MFHFKYIICFNTDFFNKSTMTMTTFTIAYHYCVYMRVINTHTHTLLLF